MEGVLSRTTKEPGSRFFSAEGILNSLSEFKYDPDSGSTFPAYFHRYDAIFMKRCEQWSDEEKITLLHKLGTEENTKYANLILPLKPVEITFSKTVEILLKIFHKRDSLFHTRYKCLNIVKQEDDDYVTYAGLVHAQSEAFKLKELSSNMFKCLIFVQSLTALKDKEIRSSILTIMKQDPNIALQKVTEECQ